MKIHINPVLAASLLMLVCLLPLMILRDFTPANELRYLSIADEAIADGHFFTFYNHGIPYADKPPLYFWLIMLCRTVFGTHSILALSLFSFIPASVIMAVMDKWVFGRVPGRDTAHGADPASGTFCGTFRNGPDARVLSRGSYTERFATALMLGTSAMFFGMLVFLRMDMLMCMFIVLALFIFFRLYSGAGNTRLNKILLPVYIFLALFTKGPVGLLMPVVSIMVFLFVNGRIRSVGRYLGWRTWGILLLLCGVWFVCAYMEGGASYMENLLVHQTVDRAVDAFHHKEPFWYYFVTIWYIIAPYSLLLVPLVFLFRKNRNRLPENGSTGFPDYGLTCAGLDTVKLFLSVIGSTFVMLSVFSSKLTVYLLPVFPFMVYLLPLIIGGYRWNRWFSASIALPSAIFIIAGLAGIAGLSLYDRFTDGSGNESPSSVFSLLDFYSFADTPAVYIALCFLCLGGIISLYCLFPLKQKQSGLSFRSWQLPVTAISVSMLFCIFSASFAIPAANDFVGYRNICRAASEMYMSLGGASENTCGKTPVIATVYVSRSQNMDVYLNDDVHHFGWFPYRYLDSEMGPHVLIVKASRIEDCPELRRRLSRKVFRQIGEYRLYPVYWDGAADL